MCFNFNQIFILASCTNFLQGKFPPCVASRGCTEHGTSARSVDRASSISVACFVEVGHEEVDACGNVENFIFI